MKILQINSVCGSGSTGKIAVQISDYLNEKDVENYIAYGYNRTDRTNTYYFGNMPEAHLHSFISRKRCMQGYGSWFATLKLMSYIKRIRPDIVHLHNIHGHYLNFIILFDYLNKTDIKVVWTFHDCWSFTGKCVHFTEAQCCKWKKKCFDCPQLSEYPDSTYDRSEKNYAIKKRLFTANKNLHIVTVSKWLKEMAEQSYFADKDIRYIYNGIDTKQFKYTPSDIRSEYGIGNSKLILGVAGIWNKRKHPEKFIELARIIPDVKFVLIGKQLHEYTWSDNIICIEGTDSFEELCKWYSAADLFINFSKEETFGLVAAEAMSCGTPAMVMDSTACPEVVIDKNMIMTGDNIEVIKNAVLYNLANQEDRQVYAKYIKDKFSVKRMQEEYFRFYKEIGR